MCRRPRLLCVRPLLLASPVCDTGCCSCVLCTYVVWSFGSHRRAKRKVGAGEVGGEKKAGTTCYNRLGLELLLLLLMLMLLLLLLELCQRLLL